MKIPARYRVTLESILEYAVLKTVRPKLFAPISDQT